MNDEIMRDIERVAVDADEIGELCEESGARLGKAFRSMYDRHRAAGFCEHDAMIRVAMNMLGHGVHAGLADPAWGRWFLDVMWDRPWRGEAATAVGMLPLFTPVASWPDASQ